MAKDKLERPQSTWAGTGAVVTASGTGDTVLDFGGAPIDIQSELRIGGAVSGTGPTLDVKYQESTTGTGSWTDVQGAAHAQQTATMHESAAAGATGADPNRITFRTSKRYVRASWTIGGSATPTFNGVTLGIEPTYGERPATARG